MLINWIQVHFKGTKTQIMETCFYQSGPIPGILYTRYNQILIKQKANLTGLTLLKDFKTWCEMKFPESLLHCVFKKNSKQKKTANFILTLPTNYFKSCRQANESSLILLYLCYAFVTSAKWTAYSKTNSTTLLFFFNQYNVLPRYYASITPHPPTSSLEIISTLLSFDFAHEHSPEGAQFWSFSINL